MLPGRSYSLEDGLWLLRTRYRLILVPLMLGILIGGLAYGWTPAEYESETLIMVIPQRIPDTYVKSTITSNVEDRLRSISEQIMSRSRLERIIRDLGLYPDQIRTEAMEDLVKRMRDGIELKLEGKESSFRLTYSSPDALTAQRVTERLAALYIDENLRDREQLAESASSFLESQLQEAKRQLVEQERKLELYRRRYAGQLPSQLQGNLQSLQSAQLQFQSLEEAVNRSRERRLLVERQIADVQSLPDVAPGSTAATPPGTAVPLTEQLENAIARREALRSQYTADHPDVLAADQTIQDLRARMEAERRSPTRAKPLSAAELAQQKRLRGLQAELEVIDHQIGAAQAEEQRLKATMAAINANVATVPTRESELVELTRDYSTLQQTYSSLLSKREDSKLAANLERRQIGEQFKILDPASLPEKPYNEKRRLAMLVGGPLAGLLLGFILIALLEYLDSSFRVEDEISRVLSIPVLAVIPIMESDDDEAERRRRKRQFRLRPSVLLLVTGSVVARIRSRLQTQA